MNANPRRMVAWSIAIEWSVVFMVPMTEMLGRVNGAVRPLLPVFALLW